MNLNLFYQDTNLILVRSIWQFLLFHFIFYTAKKPLRESWKTIFITFLFFEGWAKCRCRSVSPCLLLRMAGCTSRCRQGLLKLMQSLQRMVSGTLTKGKLHALQLTCNDFLALWVSFFYTNPKTSINDVFSYLKHPQIVHFCSSSFVLSVISHQSVFFSASMLFICKANMTPRCIYICKSYK